MILGLIIMAFLNLAAWLLDKIPIQPQFILTFTTFINYVKMGLYFVDSTVFFLVINVVVSYMTLQLTWSIIEWLYKKIPGVS